MTEPENSTTDALRHILPANLLHDLRTPLNQIIGYSEMLLEQAQEEGQTAYAADLQKTHAASLQLLALINDSFQASWTFDAPSPPRPPHAEKAPPSEPAASSFVERTPAGARAACEVKGSLLIVDDIESNRAVLSRRLERQGYAVAVAESGLRALEMLRVNTYDLVLLDIMMPEMDGYEVLERLKADETLRQIPVIMISALSELDSVVRCIEMGAEDYLPKPFNPTLLKARIGACLEKKHAHDREVVLFGQLQENHQRLQKLERLRDDTTNMVIHDLRSPLNGMVLGMHAVKEMGDLNPDQQEMMALTLGGAKTLVHLINELLDISKMESGVSDLDLGEIAATDLVEAAVLQVAALASERNLTLAVEMEPGLPRFVADEARLLRALVNLLGNAIKFTSYGGAVTIAVRAAEAEPSLLFSVHDTGEGIPSEAFGRIFEKFGQVHSRRDGQSQSTGLGLTYCKLTVEAHGGQIAVESAPGQGSTFTFTIPLTGRI